MEDMKLTKGYWASYPDGKLRYGDGRQASVGTVHTVDGASFWPCGPGLHASNTVASAASWFMAAQGDAPKFIAMWEVLINARDCDCAKMVGTVRIYTKYLGVFPSKYAYHGDEVIRKLLKGKLTDRRLKLRRWRHKVGRMLSSETAWLIISILLASTLVTLILSVLFGEMSL